MITTELRAADDPAALPILSTAGRLSIPFLKPGYYHYKFVDVRKELEEAGNQFRGLVAVAEKYGVQVGYHNHAGYIGAPVWDMARVMDTLDSKWAGYYFDLQHATGEGGIAGWKIDALLAMPRIKMLAVKDMYWKKTAEGWFDTDCPLGQGMCRYKEFLKMVALGGFHGPISLHLEYETPGVSTREGIALSAGKGRRRHDGRQARPRLSQITLGRSVSRSVSLARLLSGSDDEKTWLQASSKPRMRSVLHPVCVVIPTR